MALATRRWRGPTAAVAGGELDDGAAFGRGHSRLRDDLQSVSARSDPQHSAVWGDASLYPRAGELVWSEHLRDPDLEPSARHRQEPLRHWAHVSGVLRPDDHPIFAEVHDAAAASFWRRWSTGHAVGRWPGDVAADA